MVGFFFFPCAIKSLEHVPANGEKDQPAILLFLQAPAKPILSITATAKVRDIVTVSLKY